MLNIPNDADKKPANKSNLAVSPCLVFRQHRIYRIVTTVIGQIITNVNNLRVGSISSLIA